MTDIPDRLTSDDPSELASAEHFVAQHGARVRWSKGAGWRLWTGTHWAVDGQDQVMRLAKVTSRSMVPPASVVEDKALARWWKHIGLSQNAAGLSAMLRLAASEEGIAVDETDFDQAPWLLNCTNGTLDLHTGTLRPADPRDLLTKVAPVAYDPTALCPQWDAFLRDVFQANTELITFVQTALGYSLTGDVSAKVLFILHGAEANNGKSTLLATISAMLGPYATNTKADTFLAKRFDSGIGNDIAKLVGTRLVTTPETERNKELAVALVKELSGATDKITVRFLHHEFFDFVPTFKIWMATNHLPVIPDSNNGIWNRIRLIPFLVSFSTPERPLPGHPPADLQMAAKLATELPGILAWCVRGCLEWQRLGHLQAPATVLAATAAYRVEQDALAPFLADRVVVQVGAQVTSKVLYAEYRNWADEAGLSHPLSAITFGRALRDRGYGALPGGGNVLTWQGLGLLTGEVRVSVPVGRNGHVVDSFIPPCPRCGGHRWRGSLQEIICANCQHGGE